MLKNALRRNLLGVLGAESKNTKHQESWNNANTFRQDPKNFRGRISNHLSPVCHDFCHYVDIVLEHYTLNLANATGTIAA